MIQLNNISKIYNIGKSNEFYALKNISLTINDGDFICITGKSGAGKSTLLHILGCIDSATSGSYLLDGKEILKTSDIKLSEYRNSYFGFVMQDYALINDLSAYDNILLPAIIKKGHLIDIQNKIEKVSSEIGITHILHKRVNTLSGGEKQRVAISRAIINNPNIIIADEPTGNLDSLNAQNVFSILKNINQKHNVSIVVVTHDNNFAKHFKKQVLLNDGKIESINI